MKEIRNIYYSPAAQNDAMRVLDIYLPDGDEAFPVFVYFHGGGLAAGNRHNDAAARTFTNNGIAFVTVEYRMYPEAKYPEFIEDCAEAVKWTVDNISKYCHCSGVYVGGSSAGGYLSMMLCFDDKYYRAAGVDPSAVKGYFHDAGQPTKHFNVLRECGLDTRRIIVDEAAPIYHIDAEKEYPPMHFVISDNDMENRYEQTMLMLSTLKHFGLDTNVTHTVMNGTHCAYISKVDENGNCVLAEMVTEFIRRTDGK